MMTHTRNDNDDKPNSMYALHYNASVKCHLLHLLTVHLDYLSVGIPYQLVPRGDDRYSSVAASKFPFGYSSVHTIYVSLSSLCKSILFTLPLEVYTCNCCNSCLHKHMLLEYLCPIVKHVHTTLFFT